MNTHRRDQEPSLEARLRADARAARVAPPEGMEQRISAAVWREADAARHAPQREPRRRSFRLFPPALAGLVTSACAIALVVVWHGRSEEATQRNKDIQYLVKAAESLPARLASAELPSTKVVSVPAPLAREIESVRTDARSALDFLAANFLPSSARIDASSAEVLQSTRET